MAASFWLFRSSPYMVMHAKEKRPSFTAAARPEQAEPLVDYFIEKLRTQGFKVETGVFGAHMEVEIHNDGPVTLMVEREAE